MVASLRPHFSISIRCVPDALMALVKPEQRCSSYRRVQGAGNGSYLLVPPDIKHFMKTLSGNSLRNLRQRTARLHERGNVCLLLLALFKRESTLGASRVIDCVTDMPWHHNWRLAKLFGFVSVLAVDALPYRSAVLAVMRAATSVRRRRGCTRSSFSVAMAEQMNETTRLRRSGVSHRSLPLDFVHLRSSSHWMSNW